MSKTATKTMRKGMTRPEVLKALEARKDERGIANWRKHKEKSGGLKSYGIGLTKLRKFAKELGRDAKLAKALWKTKVYDAKVIALLIDDPRTLTQEQAEEQVEQLQGGYLEHVFSSCDATLAKAPFVVELLEKWVKSRDRVRRSAGYGLLNEVSKDKRKSAPDEAWFQEHLKRIDAQHAKQPMNVKMSMGFAVQGIGMRSRKLNAAAYRIAKKLGPLEFDATGKCDPYDPAKHLRSDTAKKRFGL